MGNKRPMLNPPMYSPYLNYLSHDFDIMKFQKNTKQNKEKKKNSIFPSFFFFYLNEVSQNTKQNKGKKKQYFSIF